MWLRGNWRSTVVTIVTMKQIVLLFLLFLLLWWYVFLPSHWERILLVYHRYINCRKIMTTTTTIGPIPTIIDLPRDLLHHILSWLTNDGNSVARLSLCSTSLYESIAQHSHRLWQSMYESTWEFSSSRQLSENDDYRSEYQRRSQSDLQVKSNLREMVRDLQSVLHLPTEEEDSSSPGNTTLLDRSGYIGQAWEHALWKPLLILGQVNALKTSCRQKWV